MPSPSYLQSKFLPLASYNHAHSVEKDMDIMEELLRNECWICADRGTKNLTAWCKCMYLYVSMRWADLPSTRGLENKRGSVTCPRPTATRWWIKMQMQEGKALISREFFFKCECLASSKHFQSRKYCLLPSLFFKSPLLSKNHCSKLATRPTLYARLMLNHCWIQTLLH